MAEAGGSPSGPVGPPGGRPGCWARGARATARWVRGYTFSSGAGTSGLGRLVELHSVHSAGDAALAVSLAGTLFFGVPTGQARGQVALFLALTMAPFAVVSRWSGRCWTGSGTDDGGR